MPMTRSLFAAALSFALTLSQSLPAAPPQQSQSFARLTALAHRYYEAQARFDPVYSATLFGDNRFDDQLPITIAPAERKKRFAMYHHVQRQLAAIDRRQLGNAAALTYDLLARELRTRIGFENFNDRWATSSTSRPFTTPYWARDRFPCRCSTPTSIAGSRIGARFELQESPVGLSASRAPEFRRA
jgi:uncharacterized protein (DUF885 family)